MLVMTQILKYLHSIGMLQEFNCDLEDFRAGILYTEDIIYQLDAYGIELTENQEIYFSKYINEKTFNIPFLLDLLRLSQV